MLTLTACAELEAVISQYTESDSTQSTSQSSYTSDSSDSSDSSGTVQNMTTLTEIETADMFTERDLETDYDTSSATQINLNNETVTISAEGVYILSGTISDGQVIVEVSDSEKVQLILDGVTINSNSSAAIYVKSANKVFVSLAENSENTLSVSGEYVAIDDNNIDGAIFSKSDITFNGNGTLTINADYGHGIVGKDDVVFTSGTYYITSENHGISVNNSIRIANATFSIISGKDGIQAEHDEDASLGYVYIESGTFVIASTADCITASSLLQVDSGDFALQSGGGYVEVLNTITVGEGSGSYSQTTDSLEYSMKCFKSEEMIFNGGSFVLSAYEDTIHANANLTINAGDFYISTGDDAVHADDDLIINGGIIDIAVGYEGLEGNNITINDGDISIVVLDDGINASVGVLTINGGDIYVYCIGDGMDSNGDFVMTGGTVIMDVNSYYTGGDGDFDISGSITYTGGTVTDADGNTIDPSESSMSMGGSMSGGFSSGFSGGFKR